MGHFKTVHFEMPRFPCMNFRGWIKLIYDKITLIYFVDNAFNPISEVQNIENGVFQNAPFANAPFGNGRFQNRDYNCIWATTTSETKSSYQSCHRLRLTAKNDTSILQSTKDLEKIDICVTTNDKS